MKDPRSGLQFDAPRNWNHRIRQNPGIFRVGWGGADISGWAYSRTGEQLPETEAELRAASDRLVARAKARSKTFRLVGARITKFQGNPAIEIAGTQQIFGTKVGTRSVHVYRAGEYVFELLAPPGAKFDMANRQVFEPLLRSIEFAPLSAS